MAISDPEQCGTDPFGVGMTVIESREGRRMRLFDQKLDHCGLSA
jgi:hypothetical protein